MPDLCPHCGYNLKADEAIEAGPWLLEVDCTFYEDARLPLRPAQSVFLHTLAKARGRVMTCEALANRWSSPETCPRNVVHTVAYDLKAALRTLGIAFPFVAKNGARGGGYRWAA